MSYDIILADPAWPYTGSTTKDAAAGKHYDLMSWSDLQQLPVRDLANKNAALFLWGTGPLLHKQVELMKHWGFHYRGVAFVWVKTRKPDKFGNPGGIISGQGVPPTFVKPTTEFLLAGTTCRVGRPFPILTSAMGQVVLAPREAHSKKPDVFHERLEELLGDRSRIELFARARREGWDTSGIELDGIDYRTGNLTGSTVTV